MGNRSKAGGDVEALLGGQANVTSDRRGLLGGFTGDLGADEFVP